MATAIDDTNAGAEAEGALELNEVEREALAQEIESFAGALSDPASRARYAQLAASVEAGAVPSELTRPLETMLELVLQTQSVRLRHGPEGEQALQRLYQRTPRGARLASAAKEVNEALGALRGQALESISFTPTPRGHNLSIETDRCHLSLVIDRSGVQLKSVEVGG